MEELSQPSPKIEYPIPIIGAPTDFATVPPAPHGGKDWIWQEGNNNVGEDNIVLKTNYIGDGRVTLTLTQDGGKWWKGITYKEWEILAVDPNRTHASSKFDVNYINNLDFGFSKAKALGIHTWMYPIRNVFQASYEYVFYWQRDH